MKPYYSVLKRKGSYLGPFKGPAEHQAHQAPPPCPGVDFMPATAVIGPLPEEHYLEFTIEEEEAGKAERVREQLALKVKRTKPRWSHQSLTFA